MAAQPLRAHPHEIKLTLLAALLSCRQREITDILVDLLITTVHRINARADTKVVNEFVTELKTCLSQPSELVIMTCRRCLVS